MFSIFIDIQGSMYTSMKVVNHFMADIMACQSRKKHRMDL